ncbi:hypothetical protein FHN55_12275 [Streptomyces sp. NP160]|uniref:hypothetical protein n=1 Tax=Streptomyces sp. NP160 TaxID=2586637 RepID=UPI001117CFB2|nr:hypothetical protein [Streptomyces sp. NP160]TNM66873.1 hypothetical protein FHN55_12275 [Streptomyces sp. NP160]
MPVVAVIDSEGERMAVWWVALDGATGSDSSRLAGAWVVPADPDRLVSLVAQRHLLICPGALALARTSGLETQPWFDANGSRTAVLDERRSLEQVHAEFLAGISAARARTLTEPQWPVVINPLEHMARGRVPGSSGQPGGAKTAQTIAAPAEKEPEVGIESDPLAQSTLRVAQWVKRLGVCWEELEAVRISRKHLRAARDHDPRPFPIRHGGPEAV